VLDQSASARLEPQRLRSESACRRSRNEGLNRCASGFIRILSRASDLDGEARRLFLRWCEAGCTVRVDKIGNIFARRPSRDPSLPPVMTGSHLDTQPTGGKFDGAYGVMAGLELVRTLNDLGYETEAPIEIVAWTNGRAHASRRRWSARGYSPASSISPRVGKARQRHRRHARRRAPADQDIISGAGHDAVYMARVAPSAMVFVRCVGGISHNETEDAKPEDLTAGCNVLLNAVLAAFAHVPHAQLAGHLLHVDRPAFCR
jgi:acetylornithine deacetylase/succinyl-diaminopimelate desuccinylase-like protein